MWNTIEPGTKTTGYSLQDLVNPTTAAERVVSASTTGDTKVVSAGDTTLFSGKKTMGKDDFLNLLVTQLRYQDPMAPQADTAFVAQLAQFSSLETQQNTQTSMSTLSDQMKQFIDLQQTNSASNVNATSTSLIGKQARIAAPNISYAGQPVSLKLQFNSGVTAANVAVKNASGEIVACERVTADKGTSTADYTWNGNLSDGSQADFGGYTVAVVDDAKTNVEGQSYVEGTVKGVQFAKEGTLLSINGTAYPMKDLLVVVDSQV